MQSTVPPDDEKSERSTLASYMQYSYVGVQFFLSVAIFTGGGIWLDRRLGTVPLFTLLGLALGFGGGLYSLYREFILKKIPSRKDRADGASGNTGPSPPAPTQKNA